MSNIRNSDGKNHLSPSAKIRLNSPESQSDATGFPHEEVAVRDSKENDSTESPRSLLSSSGRRSIAIVTPKNIKD